MSPHGSATSDPSLDQEWVQRIRGGEGEAFASLFHRFYNALCTYAEGIVGSADAAEEIVEDLFVWIWEERDGWQVRRSLRSYLFAAVRNRSLGFMRDQVTRERIRRGMGAGDPIPGMGTVVPPTDAALDARELDALVGRALSGLPPRAREAFLLSRRHGLPHVDIAAMMGISVSTVEKHVIRATRLLRDHLLEELRK